MYAIVCLTCFCCSGLEFFLVFVNGLELCYLSHLILGDLARKKQKDLLKMNVILRHVLKKNEIIYLR